MNMQIQTQPCFSSTTFQEISTSIQEMLNENKTPEKLHSHQKQSSVTDNDVMRYILSDNDELLKSYIENLDPDSNDSNLSRCLFQLLKKDIINEAALLRLISMIDINCTEPSTGKNVAFFLLQECRLAFLGSLVARGLDLLMIDVRGRSPLHYACMNGYDKAISVIIKSAEKLDDQQRSLIDSPDYEGVSPFIYAVSRGHLNCVRELLSSRDQVRLSELSERLAMCIAVKSGHREIVEILLTHKISSSFTDAEGLYPIHLACKAGNQKIIQMLLSKLGKEILDKRDKSKEWLPLFYCASEGHLESVVLLLENGCDATSVDEKCWCASTYALWNGHTKVNECLHAAMKKKDQLQTIEKISKLSSAPDELPALTLPPPLIPVYGTVYS